MGSGDPGIIDGESSADDKDHTTESDTPPDTIQHLMALGPDKLYVDCAFGCGGHSGLILSKLSSIGRLKAFAIDSVTGRDSDPRLEVFNRAFVDMAKVVQEPLAGLLLDLRIFELRISAVSSDSLADDYSSLYLGASNSDRGDPTSMWLQAVSKSELTWVIDTFALHDNLLSERITEAILRQQRARGPCTNPRWLADLLAHFQDENTQTNLEPLIELAIRVAANKEAEQLEQVMAGAFERLEPWGRCVIITYHDWELATVRRFLHDHEEPSEQELAALHPERLAELFPLQASNKAYAVRRATKLTKLTLCKGLQDQVGREGMLNVLEKVPRKAPAPSRDLLLTDSLHRKSYACEGFKEPPLPPFGPFEGPGAPGSSNMEDEDTSDPSLAKAQELQQLQSSIARRKAHLQDEGLSLWQQKEDSEVVACVKRMKDLHRSDPGRVKKAQARCSARRHIPVLLQEAVEHLTALGPDRVYVDCTFGRGGHTQLILSKISNIGSVKAFDIDPSAVQAAKLLEIKDVRFEILHQPFGNLSLALQEPIAGILLDLGVSSPQLDDARRGFSLKSKKDGPLDLRMNQQVGLPAWRWLQTVSAAQLAWVIDAVGYRLDPLAVERIAEAILQRQHVLGPFTSTSQFANFLQELELSFQDEHLGLSLTKIVFYAIRVFLNREMEQLDKVLEGAFQWLEPFGRCVVISFNRWEAMAVRRFLRRHEEPNAWASANLCPERQAELYPVLASSKIYAVRRTVRPVKPTPQELDQNPRARSSRLHVLEKVPRSATCGAMTSGTGSEQLPLAATTDLISEEESPAATWAKGVGESDDSKECDGQSDPSAPSAPGGPGFRIIHLPRGWDSVGPGEAYVEPWPDMPRDIPPCGLRVKPGVLLNLQSEALVSEAELNEVLYAFRRGRGGFRRFGARRILDFKFAGLQAARLKAPFDLLNPLLGALTAVAELSLREGETLALLQLLVNYYQDGSKAVKPHYHRCRHICCSLGASRDIEVEGSLIRMSHGDCLPLGGESHSVPPAAEKTLARVSVCIFYASAEEYAAGSVGVPAREGSVWWTHPQDSLSERRGNSTQGRRVT